VFRISPAATNNDETHGEFFVIVFLACG